MAEEKTIKNSKVDNLAVQCHDVSALERNSEIILAGDDGVPRDLTAHNAFFDPGKVDIDQSGATMVVQGQSGDSIVNYVDGAKNVNINQDNTEAYIQSTAGSGLTAVNYVTDSGNYTHTMNNANIVIEGSSGGGTVAHTVIGRGTTCHMEISNSTFVIRGGRKKK